MLDSAALDPDASTSRVDHRFTTAQLTSDSAMILVESFTLRRGSYKDTSVGSQDACHTTNKRNASSLIAIARAFHMSAWPRRQGSHRGSDRMTRQRRA